MRSIFTGAFCTATDDLSKVYQDRRNKKLAVLLFSSFVKILIEREKEFQFISMFNTSKEERIKRDILKINLLVLKEEYMKKSPIEVTEEIISICKNAYKLRQMSNDDNYIHTILALYFSYKSYNDTKLLNKVIDSDERFKVIVSRAVQIIHATEIAFKNKGYKHLKTTSNGSRIVMFGVDTNSVISHIIQSNGDAGDISTLISITLEYLDTGVIGKFAIIPHHSFGEFHLQGFLLNFAKNEVTGDIENKVKHVIDGLSKTIYANKDTINEYSENTSIQIN